ncbi:hypothetical protein D3C86_2139660 [compost metagenome]
MQQGQLPDRICIALFTVLSFAEQQCKPAQLNLCTGQIIVSKLLNMLLHGFKRLGVDCRQAAADQREHQLLQ